MRASLAKLGYAVLDAANGAEALRLARDCERRIDLLMTDAVMPELSGAQLAERLTSDRPQLQVLFMSGHAERVVMQHGVADLNRDLEGLVGRLRPDRCRANREHRREPRDARPDSKTPAAAWHPNL